MPIPSDINSSGNLWTGWSYLKFDPFLPQFSPPSGKLVHMENYKLLPNYAYPTSKISPKYEATQGGYYPPMPKNNGFNIYLDIIWSADCGGAQNCN